MAAIAILPSPVAVPRDVPQPGVAVLSMLRFTALRCRASRRSTMWEACALLSPSGMTHPYMDALLVTLEEGLGRPAVLHAPQEAERSFDEAWILRLLERSRTGDAASVEMLIRARLNPTTHRLARMLIAGLADRMDALD